MPAPPALATASLLSTRAITPRRQSTILPATVAGSSVPGKHSSASSGSAPGAAASAESTIGSTLVPAVTVAPKYSAPLPSETEPSNVRSWVEAPTVITHGAAAGAPTVPASGPALPAETDEKTPPRFANRNANASALTYAGESEPIEELMTS